MDDPGSVDPPGRKPSAVANKVARAVMAMSATQIGVIAAGFVTSISQARLLGATGRGDVTRFANASALSVLYFGLGINSAITYFVAAGTVDPRALARALRRVYVVTVLVVVACSAVAALSPLRRFLPHGLSLVEVVLAISAFFALSQLSSWLSAFRSARADFTPVNTATVTVSLAGAIGSSALLLARPVWAGPRAIVALIIGLEALRAAILLGFTLQRRAAPGSGAIHTATAGGQTASRVGFRELVRYSLLTYCGEALQFLTYRFDMWVVDAWRGAAELGRYSLAVSLAQMVWIVPTAAARVLFPYSAMLDRRDAAQLAWRTARLASLICALAAAVGALCAHFLLTTLFGSDFAEVPALLTVLLLGVVPYSIGKVLGNYLAGINALGISVAMSFAGLLVTIALDFLLIPRHGALGAAWATAISYSVYTALVLIVFIRKSKLSLREVLSSPFKSA